MLEIKMDDGSLYKFQEYTDYDITQDYVVVKDNKAWIGVFDKTHFISLIIKKED